MSKLLLDTRSGILDVVPGWLKSNGLNGHDCIDPSTREPDKTLTQATAQNHNKDLLAILNIEHWPLPKQIDKFIQLVDWWREVRPAQRIGYYSMLPQASYWAPVLGGDTERAWKQQNAELGKRRSSNGQWEPRGLVDVVDFICPHLYQAYPNAGGWDHEKIWLDTYAPANIAESRKYQKQVYPFLMPRFEQGDLGTFIGKDFLRRQIETCLDLADGCVMWDWAGFPNSALVIEQTNEVMKEFA